MYKIVNEHGVQVGRKANQVKRRIKSIQREDDCCKVGKYDFVDKKGSIVFVVVYKEIPLPNKGTRIVGEQFRS